jgi:hypothetical protein
MPEQCRNRLKIVIFAAPRVTSVAGEGRQPPFGSPDLGGLLAAPTNARCARVECARSNPNQPATLPIEPQPEENPPDGVDFLGSKP